MLDYGVEPFTEGFARFIPSGSTKYNGFSDPTGSSVQAGATTSSSQLEAGELSTIMCPFQRDTMHVPYGSAMFVAPRPAEVALANPIIKPKTYIEYLSNPIVKSFAEGIAGDRPSADTVMTAAKIVEAAIEKAAEREIEVDDMDGALSFELRLKRGLLVVGELNLIGNLHVNIYDDEHPDDSASIEEIWVEHLPQTSAEDLIASF